MASTEHEDETVTPLRLKIGFVLLLAYLAGVCIMTPYYTASYSIDLCKKYDPECLDKENAAVTGAFMGTFWPVTMIVDRKR